MRVRIRSSRGITRIELLAVVGVVLLGIVAAQPMLATVHKAHRPVSCAANLSHLAAALFMYQQDNNGIVPASEGAWASAAWWVPKRDLWFYRLVPDYMRGPDRLICPADPFGDQFDFEAMYEGQPHTNTAVPSCGYGINYTLRHIIGLDDLEANPPLWPDRTILFADVGPDDELVLADLYQSVDGPDVGQPWRDGGRMLWGDGARPWYDGPTWLTARHGKTINVATIGGSVKKARTVELLTEPLESRHYECWRHDPVTGDYICWLCQGQQGQPYRHYNFSGSQLWWWTGLMPYDQDGASAPQP